MRYSHCLGLLKFPYLLNMVHEVTTIHILHNKVQAVLSKTNKYIRQEMKSL